MHARHRLSIPRHEMSGLAPFFPAQPLRSLVQKADIAFCLSLPTLLHKDDRVPGPIQAVATQIVIPGFSFPYGATYR